MHSLQLALTLLIAAPASAAAVAPDSIFPAAAQIPFTEADYDAEAHRVLERGAFEVLDNPKTVLAADVGREIDDDEMVIGMVLGGHARAYPISVMGTHELANDELGGVPIAVSW